MDNRVYLWLFSNINKYDFAGNEAIEIKNSISRMIITEESLSSEQIMNQMRIHYERFISSFYNNIYGYKNGFACKAITSAHLDCYFVKTPDGFVPIGFYKQIRPAETVMLVNNYLEQAKNDIKNEKNQLISAWQNEINDISFKYDRIEKDKTPSVAKAILGGVAALILLAFVIFSFINGKRNGKFNSLSKLFLFRRLKVQTLICILFLLKKIYTQ